MTPPVTRTTDSPPPASIRATSNGHHFQNVITPLKSPTFCPTSTSASHAYGSNQRATNASAAATNEPNTARNLWSAAQFATGSRLLACLVNEGLATAHLLSSRVMSGSCDPWAVLVRPASSISAEWVHEMFLAPSAASQQRPTTADFVTKRPESVSAATEVESRLDPTTVDAVLVPLRNVPLVLRDAELLFPQVRAMDPEEIDASAPFVFVSRNANTQADATWVVTPSVDPVLTWKTVAHWNGIHGPSSDKIARELASSVEVQSHLYQLASSNPLPTLASTPLEWESAILEGHATHPMHRTRSAAAPLSFAATKDLKPLATPDIKFFFVPRTQVHAHGTWLDSIQPHLVEYLGVACPDTHIIFPVHGMQATYVLAKYPDFTPVDASARRVPALAQASTRTVVPVDKAFVHGAHVKLSICMTITSAMRTISPYSIHNGPVMTEMAQIANQGRSVLVPVPEFASIGLRHADEQVAKTMGCILRSDPADLCPGEQLIVCGALVERDPVSRTPNVVRAFGLDSQAKRLGFSTSTRPTGKNMVLRVSPHDGKLLGFAGRDFGGCQIDPSQWRKRTQGTDAEQLVDQLMAGSFQLGGSAAAGFKIVYHTAFNCHLQRLARALNVHHDGSAWAVVRRELARHIPRGSELWKAWMETREVPAKAFLRMKCDGLYRDYVYEQVPNILLTGLSTNDTLDFSDLAHV
ncbi:IucC family-domain-containing protein [Catenaria anguillulae PL171]|uniref:IucC family-domain-containing protein n=1 Tax=Catenaria anguillulae PL171 TaxID=765915 RepID=A0A1Y2H9B6_9FUNG|nr:IucC family-domain-containing protein [Catenaria anguillulae PL171]